MQIKRLCVFCGSKKGKKEVFSGMAAKLGNLMAERNIELVYGGGKIGLMGIIADTLLAKGGSVTGVIPDFLKVKEVYHDKINQLIVVQSMHERKKMMAELSDAFVVLPGGYGTLEELSEVISWIQLGLISAPIGILNVDGFFDHLFLQLDVMVEEGFFDATSRELLIQSSDPAVLLEMLNERLAHAPSEKRNLKRS